MRTRTMLAVWMAAALTLGACGAPAAEEATSPAADEIEVPAEAPAEPTAAMPEATEADAEADAEAAPHWAYEGEEGPDHWGEIDASYATCASGAEQSPIDLTGATTEDLTNIAFHYQPGGARIFNNGHTIEVEFPDTAGSFIEVDGHRYDLKQFHFHTPSEHTFDGRAAAAELHLVHKDADDKLAVVGVMLDEGDASAALAPVWDHLPAVEAPDASDNIDAVDAAALLPAEQATYRYSGSLTTPPCTEGVSWFVMTTPMTLSGDQLAAFTAIIEGNNRPVQDLGARDLDLDTTP